MDMSDGMPHSISTQLQIFSLVTTNQFQYIAEPIKIYICTKMFLIICTVNSRKVKETNLREFFVIFSPIETVHKKEIIIIMMIYNWRHNTALPLLCLTVN